jgi:hypothetical protein
MVLKELSGDVLLDNVVVGSFTITYEDAKRYLESDKGWT